MTYPVEWRASLHYDGLHHVNKFGFSTAVGATEITIWDGGAIYAYPSTATVMKVSSASTADAAGSTGALTFLVSGLDADYAEVSETVTLTGQTAVNTTKKFLRVFRGYVASAGANGGNVGDIWIGTGVTTGGVPTVKYAGALAGENQTLMAVYTVPADKTLLLENLKLSSSAAVKVATVRLMARPFGGVFRVQEKFTMPAGGLSWAYHVPKDFVAKTDIEVRALTSVGTESVSASFDGALIPNRST